MRFVQTHIVAKVLAVAGAVALAGCASAPTTSSNAEEIDYVKVAQIERAAKAFGTQVIWVNYPTKRADAAK